MTAREGLSELVDDVPGGRVWKSFLGDAHVAHQPREGDTVDRLQDEAEIRAVVHDVDETRQSPRVAAEPREPFEFRGGSRLGSSDPVHDVRYAAVPAVIHAPGIASGWRHAASHFVATNRPWELARHLGANVACSRPPEPLSCQSAVVHMVC